MWYRDIYVTGVAWGQILPWQKHPPQKPSSRIKFVLFLCAWYTRNIFLFFLINWTLRMSNNLPERVQILGHAHILCITVRDIIIICCQIFCDFLLKSAFERIFNVMQLILFKIKWHIKWKYLIQKFHDICLSYYFNCVPTVAEWLDGNFEADFKMHIRGSIPTSPKIFTNRF